MKVILTIFFYFFEYGILNQMILAKAEYQINNVVPSYLYRDFDNVKENIFPEDIRIKISLSRIEGTLLYTIDKNMNQMIVTLNDGLTITLGIEFRKKETFISIPELCNCQRCRYEILDIRIEIKDKMNIQCNTGSKKSYPYDNTISINTAYNIPENIKSNVKTSSNEGYLWLVNTPYGNNIFPNQKQLSGCIFNVWYKNLPIIFKRTTGDISERCQQNCKDNICNGGECYETYDKNPICNCTKAFLNGYYCNQSISQLNIRSINERFQFLMFKLSWKSSSNQILGIIYEQSQIHLRTVDELLVFEYIYEKENINVTTMLSKRYKVKQENILVAIFQRSSIDIHYFNRSWYMKTLPSIIDLSKEEITSVSLQSGDGQISLSYKNNPKLLEWTTLKITDFDEIKASSVKINSSKYDSNVFLIVLIVLLLLIVLSGVAFIVWKFYKPKLVPIKKELSKKDEANEPLQKEETNEEAVPLEKSDDDQSFMLFKSELLEKIRETMKNQEKIEEFLKNQTKIEASPETPTEDQVKVFKQEELTKEEKSAVKQGYEVVPDSIVSVKEETARGKSEKAKGDFQLPEVLQSVFEETRDSLHQFKMIMNIVAKSLTLSNNDTKQKPSSSNYNINEELENQGLSQNQKDNKDLYPIKN